MSPTCTNQKEERDLAFLLKKLPKDDRMRIEGFIIGLGVARNAIAVEDIPA